MGTLIVGRSRPAVVVAAAVVVVVVGAGVMAAVAGGRPSAARALFNEVRPGMARPDVEALMAGQAKVALCAFDVEPPKTVTMAWELDGGTALVTFGESGAVLRKDFSDPPDEPFLRRVRRRLGW